MGARRRSSQKQQSAQDAVVTGADAETVPKDDAAPKEKVTKAVCRRASHRQQQRAAKAMRDTSATDTAPKVPRNASEKDTAKLTPGLDDVLAAIETLYEDQLKPFGRILRKRVAERAAAASGCNEETQPDVDVKHLLTVCEECDSLQVQPEEGGDWSTTIVDRSNSFVDVYSAMDMYPTGMWGAASAYFQLLSEDDMYLPGGRYSCALELQARGLAFLKDRSLGQVCHIVQLAISQKKLLGYLNGSVVPYASSQSMMKEQAAQRNAACSEFQASGAEAGTADAENSLNMATWETARDFLRDILNDSAKSSPDMVGSVPLSNVKRLFRSKFNTELSETKLGHSKLTQLLQDERFSDICNVQLQGHGYMVEQVVPQENKTICLQSALPVHEGGLSAAFCALEPITLDMNEAGTLVASSPSPVARWPPTPGSVRSLVRRTFIHTSPPPPTPPPNARRRSASLPKDAGSLMGSCEALWPSLAADHAEETDSTIDSSFCSDGAEFSQSCATSGSSRRPSMDDPVKVLLRECSRGATLEPMKVNESAAADSSDSKEDVQPHRRLLFCPDEPLALEEAGICLEDAPVTQTPGGWPSWSGHLASPDESRGYAGPDEGSNGQSRQRLQFCPDEPLALEEAGMYLDSSHVPQTPYTPQWSPGWSYLAPSAPVLDANQGGAQGISGDVEGHAPSRGFQFCLDEPLDLEEAGVFIDSLPVKTSSRWPCLSPSSRVRDGYVGSTALSKVQNTFIHSPLLPPTPLRVGASRRSRSLPKNVGSDKNTWEATCQALGCSPHCREENASNMGDLVHTPSVYVDWPTPRPTYTVPPSPDFPTYCKTPLLGSGPSAVFLASAMEHQSSMSDFVWPEASYTSPNVIRLADFLQ